MEMKAITIECVDNKGLENRLQVGKTYNVEQDFNMGFAIVDEEGKHSTFNKNHFKVLKWKSL